MSLRITPNTHTASVDSTKYGEAAPSAPALQDILRTNEGPLSIASKVNGRHLLEGRIQSWESTQHELRMEQYRRLFGAAEPIKREMELKIVEATDFVPSVLGGSSNVHRDILLNKDTSIDWEDVYTGFEHRSVELHTELERKMGI